MHRPSLITGRVLVKLCDCNLHAPAHLDVVSGAARPLGRTGQNSIDRAIHSHVSAMRVRRVFHAASTLAYEGERAQGYDTIERNLGLDRIVALDISKPERAQDVANDLTQRDDVDWAMAEPMSLAPMDIAPVRGFSARDLDPEIVREPFNRVGAFEALDIESGDASIPVAVVDTGVSLGHPEFRHRIMAGVDTVDLGLGPIGSGATLVGDSDTPDALASDETGHGSHVAGIIAANGDFMPPGIGGRSSLIPVRALAAARSSDGRIVGIGGTMDIDAAVKAAVDMGARVLNLSFGTSEAELPEGAPPVHADTTEYAASRGAVLVAAMGNSAQSERFFPAALDHVIAVGAIQPNGRRASFSTMGDHIALSAPGENIISAGLKGYRSSTGTSHAAPFVTGTVALMMARADRAGVVLAPKAYRDILIETATPAHPLARPDEVGAGLLNAANALSKLDTMLQHRKGQSYE